MPYVTQQQLTDRYGEKMLRDLSDRATPPSGAIDATVVARALADADAMIDGYLAGRYVLPLATTPPLLTDIAGAIAIYKLHRQVAAEKIRLDYEDAVKRLGDLGRGVIRLSVSGVEPDGSSAGSVRTNSPARPLGNGTMEGLI